jgi:uncharacterized membrane protein
VQAAPRRNTELSLLILALLLGAGALALVALARNSDRVSVAVPLMATVAVAYVAAHFAMRKAVPQADSILLPVTALLNALGLAAV